MKLCHTFYLCQFWRSGKVFVAACLFNKKLWVNFHEISQIRHTGMNVTDHTSVDYISEVIRSIFWIFDRVWYRLL